MCQRWVASDGTIDHGGFHPGGANGIDADAVRGVVQGWVVLMTWIDYSKMGKIKQHHDENGQERITSISGKPQNSMLARRILYNIRRRNI